MITNCQGLGLAVLVFAIPTFSMPQPSPAKGLDIRPTIDNMTMHGPGCPIGGAGIVRDFYNNAPVIAFPEWNLSLADADSGEATPSVSKFCTEEFTLGNIPSGNQLRLSSFSIAGWADLQGESTVSLKIETQFSDKDSATGVAEVKRADLRDNTFNATVSMKPEIWSPCVDSSGKLPTLLIKTTISLNGTKTGGSATSSGTVGGEKMDMKKALRTHFTPEWKVC